MATVVIAIKMEMSIWEIGATITGMGRAPWSTTTALTIREVGRRESSKVEAYSASGTEIHTTGSGFAARCTAQAFSIGRGSLWRWNGNVANSSDLSLLDVYTLYKPL